MCLAEYGLDFFHCAECNDTGTLNRRDEAGILWSRNCPCMERRKNLKHLKKSGLESLIRRYRFDNYRTVDNITAAIKEAAEQYCMADPAWFYISGRPGSGKTHICTAICRRFLKNNQSVYYVIWPDEAGKLKLMKAGDPPDPEYMKELERLKTVAVLYIDDFFKGKVTDADKNLAGEILNARYNKADLRTIISSELNLNQLGDMALSGRINERARGNVFKAPNRDWRTGD